jgi:hypothetical protein
MNYEPLQQKIASLIQQGFVWQLQTFQCSKIIALWYKYNLNVCVCVW